MGKLRYVSLLFGVVAVVAALASAALAQVLAPDAFSQVCADDGFLLRWGFRALMTIGGGAILANVGPLARSPYIGPLVNFIGANWVSWLRQAAQRSAVYGVALVLALSLVACSGNFLKDAQTVQGDITAGIAAACLDAHNAAAQFPLNPVSIYAEAACPAGFAAATLAQNSATVQWLGTVIGQIQASTPAPAAAPPAVKGA